MGRFIPAGTADLPNYNLPALRLGYRDLSERSPRLRGRSVHRARISGATFPMWLPGIAFELSGTVFLNVKYLTIFQSTIVQSFRLRGERIAGKDLTAKTLRRQDRKKPSLNPELITKRNFD